jgi:hypothetical protein
MMLMDEKKLSIKELSELIKISAKSGLTELKFGDLELRFGKNTEKLINPSVKEITAEQHDKQNKETLEIDTVRLKKDQLDQLFLENPSLAESLLLDGELDDDGDESED